MSASPSGVQALREILTAGGRGVQAGVTSVCSAEPFVLEAAAAHAACRNTLLCIESTASQVNQLGGYTRQTPARFRDAVRTVAAAAGVPAERFVLGGDHLGPYPWRDRPAATAMAHAAGLVHDCVLAGYQKLHLDASMSCSDDPGGGGALDDETATARTATLCRAAEEAHAALPAGTPAPVYVIGTEVPAPGGERAGDAGPQVTPAAAVERTLELARAAFASAGVGAAWERVVAVVAQPGVEFGDDAVADYDPGAAAGLAAALHGSTLVFEAHSTDYQTPAALARLVADGFAILKVGPWLTFAFREALFALESVEREWLGGRRGVELSGLRATLEGAMLAAPEYWEPYYAGDAEEVRFKRAFSYSDRCRYYWPRPEVRAALARLLRNLAAGEIPATLLSQYLPDEYAAVRMGATPAEPRALIGARVGRVLDLYADACGTVRR